MRTPVNSGVSKKTLNHLVIFNMAGRSASIKNLQIKDGATKNSRIQFSSICILLVVCVLL